jgi:hypothetical protein
MVNLELKPGWVKEKTGKEKTRLTPATQLRPCGLTRRPGCNPLTFVFLTKMMSF